MPWPTSNHESPDIALEIPNVVAPHYLWGILKADGQPFRADDYRAFRENISSAIALFGSGQTAAQRPSADVSEQRLRTWKKAFEDMGILSVQDDVVVATRFGKAIVDGWTRVDDALRGANSRIAILGAEVANRILLNPPGKVLEGVPTDADLHPIRAIWQAFRNLDDQLHWQDVNRVLGHIHYDSEISGALERIRDFRKRHGGSYSPEVITDLGTSVLSDDPRHITPWLNRASLGGLLFSSDATPDGYRTLTKDGRATIDEMLAYTPSVLAEDADYQEYLRYLMEPVAKAESPIEESDEPQVKAIIDAVEQFGGSKFIVLAGLPGTGKTRLARIVGEHLVDADHSRLRETQFHESTSYEDFVEGFIPRQDGSGFALKPKILRAINDRALANPNQRYVLIIEEFTRANTHSVLGELLTYIEHRGREFTWSSSQEVGKMAANLVIITTMNPRDRSALQLDYAVKRRMHTINIGSSVEALASLLTKLPEQDGMRLKDWFSSHLGLLPFGHGVFAGLTGVDDITKVWRGTVVPLLSDATGAISPAYKQAHDEFPFS